MQITATDAVVPPEPSAQDGTEVKPVSEPDFETTAKREERASRTYQYAAIGAISIALGLVAWAVSIRYVLFNTNTATGGDMGAHVWTADFVTRKLVPQGRITGWSDDWFAGFPVLGFYFPFPFWLMTILNGLLPYNIAFKFVTVLGLLGMPLTGWALGHHAGLRKPLPVFCGLATIPFLMDRQWAIYGGNIKSTMAGEFSFALSLCVALLFLGLLAKVMRSGERRASAGAVLAMVGLSHLLPTIWVGVAGTAIILTHLDRKRTNIRNSYAVFLSAIAVAGILWLAGSHRGGIVVAGFLILAAVVYDQYTKRLGLGQFGDAFAAVVAGTFLASFWIWPFWNHLPYTNDMGYEKETKYLWNLFPWVAESWPDGFSGAEVVFFAFCFGLIGAAYSLQSFGRAIRRLTRSDPKAWYGWGVAFCTSLGLLVTAYFWNDLAIPGNPDVAAPSALGQLFSLTSLCRLMTFTFVSLIALVIFFAWAVDDEWQRFGVALVMVTAGCGLTFRYIPYGFRLWNNRVLPFWLMGTYILAGFGIYAIGKTLSRAFNLATKNSELGRNRHAVGVVAGLLATWAAVGVPLGILPKFLPALHFTRDTTTLTKGDGSTEEKRTGPWLVGLRQIGDSGDFGASEAAGWPQYNYQGYENRGGNWIDYKNIMDTMKKVGVENGCGRANWEYESKQDRWGTPMALMLLPYWTDSCIQSMEGLYFESAPTVPSHWMNSALLSKAPSNPQRDLPYSGLDINKGVKKLQEFGVRYYMAFSIKAIEQADVNPDLQLITTTKYERACDAAEDQAGTCPKKWNIYLVKSADLVAELPAQPVVVKGIGQSQQEGWLDQHAAIYQNPERFPAPFVAEGPNEPPSAWERINVGAKRTKANEQFGSTYTFNAPKKVSKLEKVNITNIKAASLGKGEGRPGDLSFSVDKIGVPVTVKISYFPNFKLEGAKGPYRLSNNMMVVIPTQKNVSMSYRWDINDYIGFAGGLLGISMCVLMWQLDRRSRKSAESEEIASWRAGRAERRLAP